MLIVITILSAIVVSSAWYCSCLALLLYCGGLFLFALSLHKAHLGKKEVCIIFIWHLIFFSIHFVWLAWLLFTKSNASLTLIGVLYSGTVIVCSLVGTLCMYGGLYFFYCVKELHKSALCVIPLFMCSLFLLEHLLLWPLEGGRYRPLSPFFPFVLQAASFKPKQTASFMLNNEIKAFYLPAPPPSSDPYKCAYDIYYSLYLLHLEQHEDENKKIIIFAPESTFPFPLNEYPHYLSLWNCVLPKNALFLIGALRSTEDVKKDKNGLKERRIIHQSLFLIINGRISEHYDKQLLTPFCEKLSKNSRSIPWMQTLFLKDKQELAAAPQVRKLFALAPDYSFQPLLCSEAFLGNPFILDSNLVCIFCNDSWFISAAAEWMKALSWSISFSSKKKVLFIGHKDWILFE